MLDKDGDRVISCRNCQMPKKVKIMVKKGRYWRCKLCIKKVKNAKA